MDNAARTILNSEPLDVRLRRLTAYTKRLCDFYCAMGVKPHAFSGKDPVDFAMEAIEAVYSGQRAWDPSVYPHLDKHLQFAARSIISNALRSADNKISLVQPADAVGTTDDANDDFLLDFHEYLADEPDLQTIVECIYYGNLKREDIADCAEITPTKMTNSRKRLQTRLRAFRNARLEAEGSHAN